MINVFQPTFEEESFNLLRQCKDKRWLGKGDLTVQFAEMLRSYFNASNLGLASCASDTIFAIIAAMELPCNSKIALPVNSFPALLNAILTYGHKPVYIDINENTGNICLQDLSVKSEGLSAVFLTHYGGTPICIDEVRSIIGKNTLVLEDSACALGSFSNGIPVGSQADFSCWSFDSMKLITCGEGAAYICKDDTLFKRVSQQLYLGLPLKSKTGLDNAKNSAKWWEYDIEYPGFRSVFTDINAAIGIPNLQKISQKLYRLKEIRRLYESNLNIKYVEQQEDVEYSNYFFTILVEKNRDELASILLEHDIYSTLRYSRLDETKIGKPFSQDILLKGADSFYDKALNIPMHTGLSDEEVTHISNVINEQVRLGITC